MPHLRALVEARRHPLDHPAVHPVPRVRADLRQGRLRGAPVFVPTVLAQPVAAQEVAAALVDAAEAGPKFRRRTPDLP